MAVLADVFAGAKFYGIGDLEYLEVDFSNAFTDRLAAVVADMTGTPQRMPQIKAALAEFLSENDHIHLEAFINICLEDILI